MQLNRFNLTAVFSCAMALLAHGQLVSDSAHAARITTYRETIRAGGSLLTSDTVRRGRNRAQFHVNTLSQNGLATGRLDFRDRAQSIDLRSRSLSSYEVVDAETRRLTFALDSGGLSTNDSAVIVLRDLGRRGRFDFFEITVGDYFASGNLRSGNVVLRRWGCDDL